MPETRQRLRLLYNPFAGRRKLLRELDTVIKLFQESGYNVSVHRASSPQNIEQAAAMADDVDVLVIAGGDGSIHLAVNGLLRLPPESRPVLGILPVGTANDLAYALHLPKSLSEACGVIGAGHSMEMDLGMVNGQYFVNVASAGFLTDVSPKVDVRVKNSLGQLAYYLKGLETLPSTRSFVVTYRDGEEEKQEEVMLLLAVNGLSIGGIRNLVPTAALNDGKLDFILVRQSGWPEALRLLIRTLRKGKMDGNQIIHFQSEELIVGTERTVSSDLDGEWGPESPWHIKLGPKIRVLYNPKTS